MSQRFPYELDRRYLPIWAVLGMRPGHDVVELTDDGKFVARYGWVTLSTPLENIDGAHVTENYRWWTAPGIRFSQADDGLSFGTNRRHGVCVHFKVPVQAVKVRPKGHSALTVTVEEPESLVHTLGY